jgi:acyl-CoA synthetase (NDP forming)
MSDEQSAAVGRGRMADRGREVVEAALARRRSSLSEHEAKQVLAAYGIPVTAEQLVTDALIFLDVPPTAR